MKINYQLLIFFCFNVVADSISWTLLNKPAIFGNKVSLKCHLTSASLCCDSFARKWSAGKTFDLIILNGVSSNKTKYTEIVEHKYNISTLIITDFNEKDVNIPYECTYGFETFSKILELTPANFEYQPRFVSGNEHKQYGQFGRVVSLEVNVYSYPFFHKLEVLKNEVCCVNNSAHIHVENTTVEDRIFEKKVHLKGYKIKVHGFELTGTDFTSYEFRIGNAVNNTSYTVTLTAAEKPQPPTIKDVLATTASLKIFWIQNFDGGTRQHFVLLYKKDTDVDWRNESISTDNVHVLENLESDVVYMLRIYARNDLGNSNYTEPWTIKTLAKEKGTGQVVILTGTILGCVIVITGCVMSALWFFKKVISGFQRKEEHARENGNHENINQVDLAVESSIYQSYGQNQTQQDEQNVIDQRTVLLSKSENETMYHNSQNTFPCNEDHMAVENYIYQNQGACVNENVQVNSASRICFRKRNSFATAGNTGVSTESICNEQLKIKGKQKSSAMTNNTDSIIQENQSMNYSEVVFDGRSSSQGVVIRGINDRTIYADIDITAVGTPLPENSQSETVEDDDDDDDFMYIDEIVDYRKSKKM